MDAQETLNHIGFSQEFSAANRAFDTWARDTLFLDAHRIGTDILEKAVDIHLKDLYTELDFHELLKTHDTAPKLADALNFSDSAWIALDAMLKRLADRHDFLDSKLIDSVLHFIPKTVPSDDSQLLATLQTEMAALGEDYLSPMEFLQFGRTHFVRSLRDDHTFMDRVLTGQESEFAETWHSATNTDPLQDIHGIMGGKAVELLFAGGSVLEVGGGTGNGIRNNLNFLDKADKLSSLEKYIFTDVSMQFIVSTRREFKEKYPNVKCDWRLLNINKSFEKQRIEENSADMVYGVNAAHIAKNIVNFVEECKRLLKPGGLIVFSERVRRHHWDMAPREIVLNLSSYHRTAAIRNSEYRPTHAYLTKDQWIKALELAGCKEVAVWPELDPVDSYFPDQYAAVVVARA